MNREALIQIVKDLFKKQDVMQKQHDPHKQFELKDPKDRQFFNQVRKFVEDWQKKNLQMLVELKMKVLTKN